MRRRLFLQLSAGVVTSAFVPAFANTPTVMRPSFSATDLDLPADLQNNPLLFFDGLPDYAAIKSEHVAPAVDFLLDRCRAVVLQVSEQASPTWESFYAPLDDAGNFVDRAWASVSHLHAVKNSDDLRQAYDRAKQTLSDYGAWYSTHRPLYEAFLRLKNSAEYPSYSQAQKKAIDNALLDFRLSGMDLDDDGAKRYRQIKSRLAQLSNDFSNNVLDATMGWELWIDDESQLAGLPDSAKAAARSRAAKKNKNGFCFGLDYPSYVALISYADDRNLRKRAFEAYRTRASDQGPDAGKWDNGAVLNEILRLRQELAQLLGFAHYADYALQKRMAKDPAQVLDFLDNLLQKARPKAQEQAQALEAFGQQLGLIDTLRPWDFAYLAEKQKQSLYRVDKESLRAYFPVDKVLQGLFETAHRLFGVTVAPKNDVSLWHEDAQFFEIHKNGAPIAAFSLDLYARDNKRGGAWMSGAVDRKKHARGVQLPVAHLVCNFGKTENGQAQLLHEEVETLFHEFGHGLHHTLTEVDVAAVAGMGGVAWDAVELPSQLLENWTWQKEGLKLISSHHQSGAPLPEETLNNLIAAKNHLAACAMVRQLEFAIFDFRLHTEYQDDQSVARLRDELKKTVAVIDEPDWTRTAHSFSHIFAGGYAAGYYSYLWADVLASDAFLRFESEGIFNAKTGQDFLDAFLGQGGSDDPMQLFIRFRGQAPTVDALLQSQGIAKRS